MPQKGEDPEESKDWEADKEPPAEQDTGQGDEDPKETKDWEKDKEGNTGDGKIYEG